MLSLVLSCSVGSVGFAICWEADVFHVRALEITITLLVEHNHASPDQRVSAAFEHSKYSTDDAIRSFYVLLEICLKPRDGHGARFAIDISHSTESRVLVGEGISTLIDGIERVEFIISLGNCN